MTVRIEDLPTAAQARIAANHPGTVPARRPKNTSPGGSQLEETLAAQIRAAKLPAPVRQHRPIVGRRWATDFAWPDQRLAVEVDGGTWVAGRHARGAGIAGDMEKHNALVVAGWRVLRFDNHMVTDGRALAVIQQALEAS